MMEALGMLDTLAVAMTDYDSGDPARIQHFMKVHAYAALIGRAEELDEETQFVLETAAYVHDIGIKPAEAQYGSSEGPLQERLGPPEAEKLLNVLGFEDWVVERVCYLVGHHHTYTNIDGMDYQILVEADFLVNLFENHADADAARSALKKIFVTEMGKKLCTAMFNLS